MVRHLVLWKLKPEAHGRSAAENAVAIKEKLEGLRGRVPGMLRIEVGIDFSRTDSSSDVALYAEFESRAALDALPGSPGAQGGHALHPRSAQRAPPLRLRA